MFPSLPLPILTDSYKTTHFLQYPANMTKLVAYGEFRSSFKKDKHDQRMIIYGLRYIIETYVGKKWTMEDIEKAEVCTFNTSSALYYYSYVLLAIATYIAHPHTLLTHIILTILSSSSQLTTLVTNPSPSQRTSL